MEWTGTDRKPIPKGKENPRETPSNLIDKENFAQLTEQYEDLRQAYSELRQELKVTDRENREQSLELRNLRRQNAMLKEDCNNIRKDLYTDAQKMSKNERNKYIEHFQMLEDQAGFFQHEYRKREDHLAYLTKQTRDANREKEDIEEDNRKLQRKIRELAESLTECRDDLLRLQPPTQTSDSEIADQYSNLCQQIAGWVDDKTEDPETLEVFFANLKAVNDLPQEFRLDVSNRQFKFGKVSPDCLPLFLQYLIHCRIREDILGPRNFVFGLDTTHTALLQGIEEGMSELEPKRGKITGWQRLGNTC